MKSYKETIMKNRIYIGFHRCFYKPVVRLKKQKVGLIILLLNLLFCNPFYEFGYAQTVPVGFSIINVNTNLDDDAVGFALLPDDRIFVVNQFSGQVRLIVNGVLKTDPLLTVPELQTSSEKGLLGIAVDPDFPNQPYVYLFHSHNSSTNRVSRFTIEGELQDPTSDNLTIDVNSQFTLVDDMPANAGNHNGGTLRFGSDQTLYISHGDDANSSLVQDLTTLNGKILRINRDGTVPADNPTFPDEPQEKREEIFAFGLRNPFRFSIDPETNELFVGDVGQVSREEFDLSTGGENFGWPRYEGSLDFNTNATLIQPEPIFPIWEYSHLPGSNSGIALVAYRQMNFPNDWSFPEEYDGSYFYADFYQDWIRNIRPDGEGGWTSLDFGTGFSLPVDGVLASDGSFYLLEYGQALKRIVYVNNTVPVELSLFTAQVEEHKVVLTWITETETNNFGFEVHRSFDGQHFEKRGFAKGQGTSTQKVTYTFEDFELRSGTIFYRLKQIDSDGGFEFSNIISVKIGAPTEFWLSQNYPNPFNSETTIQFSLPNMNLVEVSIYNLLGSKVRQLVNQTYSPGEHVVKWDGRDDSGSNVSSGIFLYTIKTVESTATGKMLLLK